jgi:hypothetical protein
MGFSRRWLVESKDFVLLVVGGETGIHVCESCLGKMRSILLDMDKLAWLVRIYEDLVVVEDSRVFWNQSQPGFPRIIAQRCFNRHGGFLVVEEFISDRRSGSVLIPEGRTGKGWEIFGSELRLALEHFKAGFRDTVIETGVQAGRDRRRSNAEVLAKTMVPLEDSFGFVSRPVARVPRWVRESSAGDYLDKDGLVPALNTRRIPAPAKISLVTTYAAKALAKPVALFCGHVASAKHSVKGHGASKSSTHFGANLELASLRETLVKLKEEVVVCLERLDYAESVVVGLLGSGPKTKVMDSRQAQCSGLGPKCVLKNPLGPQFKSGVLSTSKDWVGLVSLRGPWVGPNPRLRQFSNRSLRRVWVQIKLFLSPTQKARILPSILLMPLRVWPIHG